LEHHVKLSGEKNSFQLNSTRNVAHMMFSWRKGASILVTMAMWQLLLSRGVNLRRRNPAKKLYEKWKEKRTTH